MGYAIGMGTFSPENITITEQGNYTITLEIKETDATGEWSISTPKTSLSDGLDLGVKAHILDGDGSFCVFEIDTNEVLFDTLFATPMFVNLYATIDGSNGNDAYQYTYEFSVASLKSDFPEIPDYPITGTPPDNIVRVGNITAYPENVYFPATGGSVNMIIESDVEVEQWEYTVDSRIKITTNSQTRNKWNITLTMEKANLNNPNSIFTSINIYAYYDTEHTIYDEITPLIIIGGNQIIPIWRDTFCLFPEQYDSIKYTIESSSEIMYSGKATKYPNDNNIKINVNRVVKDYLDSHYNTFEGTVGTTALPNFVKEVNVKADGKVFATYTFYNSWSYGVFTPPILSQPIRNLLDNRQYFMCSLYPASFASEIENGVYVYKINLENGATRTYSFPISYHYHRLICSDLKNFNKPVAININDGLINYEVKQTCYDYCLYYINAFGGWDSLLIKGNVKKSDKITSSYYTKHFDNTTIDFEKVKYHNNITTSYQLHTDWFTDDEQSRLHNLLESTEVYLHNLNTDEIIPVVITNSKCDWKTFANNGKKKFYNEINVECSQTKIRL